MLERRANLNVARDESIMFHKKNHIPEYRVWAGMIHRCHCESSTCFKDYGARGIYVSKEWASSFAQFMKDMGPRPSPRHQIDRLDNNGPYSAENCAWHTASQNARNRSSNTRIECFGERLTLSEWVEKTGFNRATIQNRLRFGWRPEEALTVVPGPRGRHSRRAS